MKILMLPTQSLFDICLQETGTIESLFEILNANSLTDIDVENLMLSIPSSVKTNKNVLNYFKNNSIKPASIDSFVLSSVSNDFDDNDFDTNDFT